MITENQIRALQIIHENGLILTPGPTPKLSTWTSPNRGMVKHRTSMIIKFIENGYIEPSTTLNHYHLSPAGKARLQTGLEALENQMHDTH